MLNVLLYTIIIVVVVVTRIARLGLGVIIVLLDNFRTILNSIVL